MTITPVKDRDLASAGEVAVYWNIPRKCWALVAVKGNDGRGLLLAYADQLVLTGCRTVVQENRRQAIIRGDREICAWIIGKISDGAVVGDRRRVTFRPRERGDFFDAEAGTTVTHMDAVVFTAEGKCYAEGAR